jgi:hypothetical protein
MMRKVKVFQWERLEGEKQYAKVEKCHATFHQFGVDYEEFETGPGNYSTAIVEYADGQIDNVPVALIQFVDCKPAAP